MPLLIVALGVGLLLFCIIVLRLNALIALLIVSLAVGLMYGMPALEIIESIKAGVGGTLGGLSLILGLGAMLGSLIAESGAAQKITHSLIQKFGKQNIQWAVLLTGFIVGIPMFYSVGFVMLIPIIFSIARSTGMPILYIGIPMTASLSVTHGFLPPHPGPTAIAEIYSADIGLTLLYGLILAVPTIIVAGPIFSKTLGKLKNKAVPDLFQTKPIAESELPSLKVSIFTALVPVFLMAVTATFNLYADKTSNIGLVVNFIGDPIISLLIAVLIAIVTLGIKLGKKMTEVMATVTESVKSIAMILLIIAGGGAFKQVLIDSGMGNYVAALLEGTAISPLVLAWTIAAVLRISLGSATLAALTAGGIAAQVVQTTGVSPELMVLATGAGSLTFSNVNDTGFWMFKEYFKLSIWETFMSWTMMETIVSIMGLIGVLVLNMFI